jgi:hypothetical protein
MVKDPANNEGKNIYTETFSRIGFWGDFGISMWANHFANKLSTIFCE